MSCILYIKEEDNKIIASSFFISKYLFEVNVCVCVCVCACLCCEFVETFPMIKYLLGGFACLSL